MSAISLRNEESVLHAGPALGALGSGQGLCVEISRFRDEGRGWIEKGERSPSQMVAKKKTFHV
jgi:hypothetical protein